MTSVSSSIYDFTTSSTLAFADEDPILLKEANASGENPNDKVWGMPKYDHNHLGNLSDDDYLAAVLGPKNVGLPLLIPITFLYVGIFITGVIGNIAVCLVIVKNKSMHTATNYYLFSLAVSDLMILVLGLPNDLAIYWQQYPWVLGETLCKGRSLVSEMTSYSSVLTIVAFSMERYLAICHPLYAHTMSGFKRAVRIIALVWIISLIAAIPYALFTRLNYIDRPLGSENYLEESAFCALLDDNIYPKNYPVYELSSFIFFIFPMWILVILYIRMGLRIRDTSGIQRNLPRSSSPQNMGTNMTTGSVHSTNNHPHHSNFNIRQQSNVATPKRSVLRMLTAVVLAFFLCWAPFHAQRLCYVYFKESKVFRTLNEYLYYVSGFLYYLSATVNPVLYNLMSLKYRHAFKQTLCGVTNRRSRNSSRGGGGGAGLLTDRRANLTVGVNRSYTFKSTSKTVVDGTASEAYSMVSGKSRCCPGGSTAAGRPSSKKSFQRRFGLKRSLSDSRQENLKPSPETNHNQCCQAHRRSSFQLNGRRTRCLYGRADFQAAMQLAENACSDIAEEESFQSSSNHSHYPIALPIATTNLSDIVQIHRYDNPFSDLADDDPHSDSDFPSGMEVHTHMRLKKSVASQTRLDSRSPGANIEAWIDDDDVIDEADDDILGSNAASQPFLRLNFVSAALSGTELPEALSICQHCGSLQRTRSACELRRGGRLLEVPGSVTTANASTSTNVICNVALEDDRDSGTGSVNIDPLPHPPTVLICNNDDDIDNEDDVMAVENSKALQHHGAVVRLPAKEAVRSISC